MKKISMGFSPCPNDTFMFEALVNKRIDTKGLEFDFVLEDVETLNKLAFEEKLDVTKLSFNAFSQLTSQYMLLNSGCALGRGCGPLVIARNLDVDLNQARIGIPGHLTTANLLFSLYAPNAKNKVEMVFSSIEAALLNNEIDAGVIIHENRFTFEKKGLKKLVDLGAYWEAETNSPIPLGGIVIKKSIGAETRALINTLLKESIQYAFNYPDAGNAYVKAHAQEINEEVMQQHINLYVNQYSLDLGNEGKLAVDKLFLYAKKFNFSPQGAVPEFVL